MVVFIMTYQKVGIEVINIIKNNGFDAYFVGGFVRDYLLNRPYNDIDIATNALPKDLKLIFETIDVGIKYNSVKIKYQGFEFETTTFRQDLAYNDYRHPVYQKADNIFLDLKRRDFTINAMALNDKMEIIDLFNGQKDLENKLIRTVGDPITKFTEDALRMLRAAYFSAKLGFKIEDKTFSALRSCGYLIQNLSFERILWEIEKILNADFWYLGLKVLVEAHLIKFIPVFSEAIEIVLKNNLQISIDDFLAIAFYFHQDKINDYSIKNVLKKKFLAAYEIIKKVKITNSDLFKYESNEVLLADFLANNCLNKKNIKSSYFDIYQSLPIHSSNELKAKAKDIIEILDLKEFREVTAITNDLLEQILNNKLANDVQEIRKYLIRKYS